MSGGLVHATGGLQVDRRQARRYSGALAEYFLGRHGGAFRIDLSTKIILRGPDYYPARYGLDAEHTLDLIRSRICSLVGLGRSSAFLESPLILRLALLDNLKNYLLLVLNAYHALAPTVDHRRLSRKAYGDFMVCIGGVEDLFWSDFGSDARTTGGDFPICTDRELALVDMVGRMLEGLASSATGAQGIFRNIRECDNLAKLAVFGNRMAEQSFPDGTLFIGIAYGGIELPFVLNAFRRMAGKRAFRTAVAKISFYSSADHPEPTLPELFGYAYSNEYFSGVRSVAIFDDSVTTGRTLERLIGLLPDNVQEAYFSAVSFTNSNRYHHLARIAHGGLNPFVAEQSVFLFRSSYTQSFSRRTYTDRRGVFDKDKNRILRYLKSAT
jgi:hypothetical protein